MEKESSDVISRKSEINYDYATIKITQSRLDKGLIAIPVPLAQFFPSHNQDIQVYLNDSPSSETKRYSSYTSSNGECRIFGVTEWFRQNNVKSGDEIVIQFLDREKFIYRLIPEHNFVSTTRELQNTFDASKTEGEAASKVKTLAEWTRYRSEEVMLNEFFRLVIAPVPQERLYIRRSSGRTKESTPAHIRILLAGIYQGHCQICDFSFLKKDSSPFFEIHHIDPQKGHHPQNLVVVCGNCHNQFEHAYVKPEFDDSWLARVFFNDNLYPVKQALAGKKLDFSKKLYL